MSSRNDSAVDRQQMEAVDLAKPVTPVSYTHLDQKDWFLAGYNEMLRRIEPEKIICYNTPFPEMQGEIVPCLLYTSRCV